LEVVLDGIGQGEAPDVRVVRNLCANRAEKDRHRRRLARRELTESVSDDATDALDLKRALVFVAQTLGAADLALLTAVIETSYSDVASATRVRVGTLKARVSRAKARVRAAWVERFGTDRVMEEAA
jgi:DNA-directed RNA polymerase specialized sigma24 family protein